jgi:hypothetical protein
MRLKADFLIRMEQLQILAANDNRFGDADFTTRNLAAVELTYTLAILTRDEGVP